MARLVSAAAAHEVVTVTSDAWWIVDPLDPTRALQLHRLRVAIPTADKDPQVVFEPINEKYPVVFRDAVIEDPETESLPLTGSVQFYLLGYDEFAMWRRIRAAQRNVLLQTDMGQNWYVALGEKIPLELQHAGDRVTNPRWKVNASWVEVERPELP